MNDSFCLLIGLRVMTPLLNDFPKLRTCSQPFNSCIFKRSKKNEDVLVVIVEDLPKLQRPDYNHQIEFLAVFRVDCS